MVSRPVAQKLEGTMIYDVLDTGQHAIPGSGVRPDKTNPEIRFHNDNAYNDTPPDYVGLLCLRQAQSGGRRASHGLPTVPQALRERHSVPVGQPSHDFFVGPARELWPGAGTRSFCPGFPCAYGPT